MGGLHEKGERILYEKRDINIYATLFATFVATWNFVCAASRRIGLCYMLVIFSPWRIMKRCKCTVSAAGQIFVALSVLCWMQICRF